MDRIRETEGTVTLNEIVAIVVTPMLNTLHGGDHQVYINWRSDIRRPITIHLGRTKRGELKNHAATARRGQMMLREINLTGDCTHNFAKLALTKTPTLIVSHIPWHRKLSSRRQVVP